MRTAREGYSCEKTQQEKAERKKAENFLISGSQVGALDCVAVDAV
jgi:hypothetical protein